MDTATDARVRLLLQIRQLLTDPRGNVGEDGCAPPPRLAATRLAMVVVCTVCQETGGRKERSKQRSEEAASVVLRDNKSKRQG